MQKNVDGQKWVIFAFDVTDLSAKTGDAAQITANLRIDGGAANAIDDTNPTELEDGYYVFDLSQAETNGDMILICPASSTGDIQVIGVPGVVFTTAPNSNLLGIEADGDLTKVNTLNGHTPQSADNATALTSISGKVDTAQSDLDKLTGTDGATLATAQANYAPAKAGDAMGLSDDAITSEKFDETSAFPIKSGDTGATQIARVGEDSDTLETISDEIAAIDLSGLDDLAALAAAISGPGDYAVTLTIRTTGGTPLSGISVWVNTTNTRSGSVAGTKITDSNGQVTFYLEYTTYYVFCHLSGYTFASASFTAASGSVTFTKDIASAVSSGSSAFYSDSFLSRSIVDVRENLDEPAVSAKYPDARIAELLEKAYIIILNEKNRSDKTPAVVKQTITVASGTTEYVLPHVMGSLYGVYDLGDTGCKVFYDGRSRYNPYGQGIWLEGQTLHIQTADSFGVGTNLTAEWIPSGIARLHNGVCTVSADGKTITFGTTPNAGALDTHHEAYSGSIFRCLGVEGTTVVGNYTQERNITAYDETTRQATLDVALDPIPTTDDDGYIYYEIAPAIHKGMDSVVALYAAYRIMTIEGNQKRAKGILDAYRNELRNVRLTAYYSNMPEAPRQNGDNFDNRRYRR